jgi:hypothetical protein
VYRRIVFRRNDVGWRAACAWRALAKADDIAVPEETGRAIDTRLIGDVTELLLLMFQAFRIPIGSRKVAADYVGQRASGLFQTRDDRKRVAG